MHAWLISPNTAYWGVVLIVLIEQVGGGEKCLRTLASTSSPTLSPSFPLLRPVLQQAASCKFTSVQKDKHSPVAGGNTNTKTLAVTPKRCHAGGLRTAPGRRTESSPRAQRQTHGMCS